MAKSIKKVIERKRSGPKVGSRWSQRSSYVKSLIPLMEARYGTLDSLANENGINRLTAIKFMRTPGKLRADLVCTLFAELGVPACDYVKVIGEGDE
jgi:hypothetical protein